MSLTGRGRLRGITVIPQTVNGLQQAFRFDACVSMRESNPGRAFRHPVQNGAEGITDAVRIDPPGFTCSGILSDTPVEYFTPRGDRAIELYELIKDIRRQKVPVTILTSWLGELRNRWPEVIEGDHSSTNANIEVQINFVKFRLVTSQTVPSFVDSDVLALGSSTIDTLF